ncbi:hypothetical protein E1193_30625, partial [Micromonospora sp. KC606]
MAKSSDETPPIGATLRIGGWLPDSRQPAQPPAPHPDPIRDRWQQSVPAPSRQTTQPPLPATSQRSPDHPTRTLVLGCLAVGVVAMLVFALAPLWFTAPRPEPGGTAFVPAPGFTQAPAPDPVSATEDATFSPAPASLSTRATVPS